MDSRLYQQYLFKQLIIYNDGKVWYGQLHHGFFSKIKPLITMFLRPVIGCRNLVQHERVNLRRKECTRPERDEKLTTDLRWRAIFAPAILENLSDFIMPQTS